MVLIGLLIVLATFVAIVKRYEVRMVLFAAGLLMAIISLDPIAAFDAFKDRMIHPTLVPVICSVMGFAYVARVTQCDKHLVRLLTNPLKRIRPILVPGAVLVTWFINISLISAAGVSAAVGVVLIPTLIMAGVHPAMAATAVFAGTYGSVMSPGNPHNVMVSDIANVGVMEVIGNHAVPAIICALIGAISLTVISRLRKEHEGYVPPAEDESVPTEDSNDEPVGEGEASNDEPVSVPKALVTMLPLVLIILATDQVGLLPPTLEIHTAMIIGAIAALIISRWSPQEVTKEFFDGMGHAFSNVIGIIVAASVFTTGMAAIGLTDALIQVMREYSAIAPLSATFGPFFVAVLGGSGDAATLAFNEAVTPHAAELGFSTADLGSVANIAGALGRTMSPVAAAAIVCAGLAGVSPVELFKRNAPGMIIAAIVLMVLMLFV